MTKEVQKISDFFGKSVLVYIDDDDEKIHSGINGVFYVTLFEWQKLDDTSKSNFVSHMAHVSAYEECLEVDEQTETSRWVDETRIPVAIISADEAASDGQIHIPTEFDIAVFKNTKGKGTFEIYRWGDPIEDIQKIGSSEQKVLKELKIDKAGLKKTQVKIKEVEEREEERRQAPIKLKAAIEDEAKNKTGELDLNSLLVGSGFPKELWELTHLKKLNLRYCDQAELPAEIGKLIQLEDLELNGNRFSTLPSEIGNLKALKVLKAQLSTLTSLPESFANLQNLEELNLYGSGFKEVPKVICKLGNLRTLNFGFGSLESLPKELADLPLLKDLGIHGLDLSNVPEEVVDEGTEAVLNHLRKS